MISCVEAVRHLWEFLDQGLPDDANQAVEEHLARCVRCCGELEFARKLRGVLRTATAGQLPDDVRGRLAGFIDDLDHAE
ncbi:zf-HC2 domain-containing protein [Jiangella asiatica]|uniref:Zf-HC2 domain-containing protein n=2 Tax=Jiangella asiatica TaxID=2530372 RepID=A0A4R5DQX0_9ACTN|nr:zf-HC2 domain-containing protein [Jiangella asiatica]